MSNIFLIRTNSYFYKQYQMNYSHAYFIIFFQKNFLYNFLQKKQHFFIEHPNPNSEHQGKTFVPYIIETKKKKKKKEINELPLQHKRDKLAREVDQFNQKEDKVPTLLLNICFSFSVSKKMIFYMLYILCMRQQ